MPFNQQGEEVFNAVRGRFQRYLSYWLIDLFNDLPDEMQLILHGDIKKDTLELSEIDWNEIESFAYTYRGYEACMWPIKKLLKKI